MDQIKLPDYLIPNYKTDLIRCGSEYDGGYLLSKSDLEKSDLLISLGIHENWEFENELYKKYAIRNRILFDPETSYFLIFKYIIKSVAKLDFKKIKNYFSKFKELNDLKSHSIFFKKKFDKKIISKYINSRNILLKIDIEGDEYKDLEFILNLQDRINCLIIEFHNVKDNLFRIQEFINDFKLNLIHTHINTYSNKNEIAIELTFSKHSLILDSKWSQSELEDINFPNHPNHRNIKVVSSLVSQI